MNTPPKSPLPKIPGTGSGSELVPAINSRLGKIENLLQTLQASQVPSVTLKQALVPPVPLVLALPKPGSKYAMDGVLVDFNKSLYRWNAALGIEEAMGGAGSGSQLLVDTHANRVANYPAASYSFGAEFFETDTKVFLVNNNVAGVHAWVPEWASPIADLSTNLGNYYAPYYPNGTLFTASDLPNRPSYYSGAGGGGCTVSGGVNVLRTTGPNFDVRWVGYLITVGGTTVAIASVADASHLTLASPVTNGTTTWSLPSLSWVSTAQVIVDTHAVRLTTDPTTLPVNTFFLESDRSYVVYHVLANGLLGVNKWNYASGAYVDVWANRPASLTAFDAGFLFKADDYYFTERWSGTAWVYLEGEGQGSATQMMALGLGASEAGVLWAETTFSHRFYWNGSGWIFAPGDPDSGYTVVTAGSAPTGGIWYAANGSSYLVMQPNGSTALTASPTVTNGWMRG